MPAVCGAVGVSVLCPTGSCRAACMGLGTSTCWAGGLVRPPGPVLLWDWASSEEGDVLATYESCRPGW